MKIMPFLTAIAAISLAAPVFAQSDTTTVKPLTDTVTTTQTQSTLKSDTTTATLSNSDPVALDGGKFDSNQSDTAVITQPQSWATTFLQPSPSKHVELDVRNVSLDRALKALFAQTDMKYEIEKDAPVNARITLRVRGISFQTALSVIAEQAGVGYAIVSEGKGSSQQTVYRIGKSVTLSVASPFFNSGVTNKGNAPSVVYGLANNPNTWSLEVGPSQYNYSGTSSVNLSPYFGNSSVFAQGNKNTLSNQNSSAFLLAPGASSNANNKGQGLDVLKNTPYVGVLYSTLSQEERSVFTCPNCHQQVTIIRKRQAPTCPTCGRVFQSEWEFCPFDGAKRPAPADDWKFCPLCGKEIPDGASKHSKPDGH